MTSANETCLYAMPPDAAHVGRLHEHGGRSDFGMHVVDFGEWAFPCGTNGALRSRLWWFMDGRLQDAPRRPGFAASAGLGETLAVQGESRLWLRADGDGRTVTWERFFACGDTNRAVNAQISLRRDGGFTVRSNDLVRVYRRVNPDDWDDDGDPNDTDPNPLVHDGESFGPHQTLPEGANTNAYCWVDLVVPDANALVTFTGDGCSALPDPTFIARAGATNRVIILIGKTYEVTSRMPIACVGRSSGEIEVERTSPTGLRIVWPVTIGCTAGDESPDPLGGNGLMLLGSSLLVRGMPSPMLRAGAVGGGRGFTMEVMPSGLGGAFTWTNFCCSVSGSGYSFSTSCHGNCSCGGCRATGYFGYEGFSLPATGGCCGCGGSEDPDDPGGDEPEEPSVGVDVYFTKPGIFFEDEHDNAPGVTVPWQSTETELVCSAWGGENGGHVTIEMSAVTNLIQMSGEPLPFDCYLDPEETVIFTNRYKAVAASGSAEDIVATGHFYENGTDWYATSVDKATAISVKIEPVATAPANACRGRHKYGVCEKVDLFQQPSSPAVDWVASAGGIITGTSQYQCPLHSAVNPLTATIGQASYTFAIQVIEPSIVEAHNASWNDFNAPVGEAGSIALLLPLYIGPFDVSFSQIAVEEVPCTCGTHSGYFNRNDFQLWWYHTRGNGAGIWNPVTEGNKMGNSQSYDQAGVVDTLPRVNAYGLLVDDPSCTWSDGHIEMENPFGWNAYGTTGETSPYDTFAEDVRDRIELQRNGRCRILKLGNEVIRFVDGSVFFNGVQAK